MLEVDDKIALDEVGEVEELVHLGALHEGAGGGDGLARALAAEELGLGNDNDTDGFSATGGPRELGGGIGGGEGEAETLVAGTAGEGGSELF